MRLVLWQARRTLPPLVWGIALLLFALPWLPGSAGSEASLGIAAVSDDASLAAPSDSGAIQGLRVFTLFLLPFLLWRGAGLGGRWRLGDVDWLGALPLSRRRLAGRMAAGTSVAFVAIALVGTLPVLLSGSTRTLYVSEPVPHPTALLLEGDGPLRWRAPALQLDQLPAGSSLCLRPTVAPGSGPAVSLRFFIEGAGGASRVTEARIHGRGAVLLPLDFDGRGGALLTLERVGAGAVLAVPANSLYLWRPAGADALARRLVPWLEASLAGWAWCLFALALGAWMRPSLAAGVAGSLASVPLWHAGGPVGWLWPGSGAPLAFDLLEHGLLAAGGPGSLARTLLTSALLALLAFGLLGAGLGRGRGTP